MKLSEYIDQLNTLYGELGDVDTRFVTLHNSYSPEVTAITTKRFPKSGETIGDLPITLILMGKPINAWPMPDLQVNPGEVQVDPE